MVFVSPGWLELAREAGAPGLTEGAVLGRPFSDFVGDQEAIPLFQLVFRRVRKSGQTIRVPFRRDSGDRRHHMEMEVLALEGGSLECRTRTLLVEERRAAEARSEGSRKFLTCCAWCKKVQVPEGTWVEVEAAAHQLELLLGEALQVTHGICPACRTAFWGELGFAQSAPAKAR
ncbi:MAG TPA: hypothetical protein VLI67_02910 [Vicinamibacteria bacterium]|nr:hypothetical protein [Vicinamibacteria bacterium]